VIVAETEKLNAVMIPSTKVEVGHSEKVGTFSQQTCMGLPATSIFKPPTAIELTLTAAP
jgi:hypothetical protein